MKLPKPILLSIVGATALTAACGETPAEQQADTMDDQIEMEADRSAVAAGTDEAALGMTEAQLLDADLVTADGTDLGDVALVRRDDNGTVTGLVGTPFPSDADVPGAEGPVEAVVLARIPGTIMSYAVSTDGSGEFSTRIVPGTGYELAALPSATPALPFLIEEGSTFTENTDLAIRLGGEDSLPVYGQVLDASGAAVQSVPVRLVDPATGIAGPTMHTDTVGVFNLRAHPGDYILEIIGDSYRLNASVTRTRKQAKADKTST